MKTVKSTFILLFTAAMVPCSGQSNQNINSMEEKELSYIDQQLAIVHADYGTCYTIGEYQLCPERKLIKVRRMFGDAVSDYVGFFPDSTLKYDEETMIIFAGKAFFDKSGLNIDWQTVELLSYREHYSEFTDGENLYYLSYGSAQAKGEKYDKNSYKPYVEKKSAKINHPDFRELTDGFHVKGKTFCYGSLMYGDEVAEDENFNWEDIWKNFAFTPIFEPFDVPNLRVIVSATGFETDYITDGKQVLFGGSMGGYSSVTKNGKEYVTVKELMIESVDFVTLRVLGTDMFVDKNALYYRKNVIPLDQLDGFKFIFREM